MKDIIRFDSLAKRIYLIRGRRVMIDSDLAELYRVSTGRLNEAVRRNLGRFPPDFMFQLSLTEFRGLISHIALSKYGRTCRGQVFPFDLTGSITGSIARVGVIKRHTGR